MEGGGGLSGWRGVGMVIAGRRGARQDKSKLAMPAMLAAAQVAQQLDMEHDEAVQLFEQALASLQSPSKKKKYAD